MLMERDSTVEEVEGVGAGSNLYGEAPEGGGGKGILCAGRINLLCVTGGIKREHQGRRKDLHSLVAVS